MKFQAVFSWAGFGHASANSTHSPHTQAPVPQGKQSSLWSEVEIEQSPSLWHKPQLISGLLWRLRNRSYIQCRWHEAQMAVAQFFQHHLDHLQNVLSNQFYLEHLLHIEPCILPPSPTHTHTHTHTCPKSLFMNLSFHCLCSEKLKWTAIVNVYLEKNSGK